MDTKISEESVFEQVYSSTCSTKELSKSMTKILHAVKGGLLSYCDKVFSRSNINQKHRIGGVMVSMLASSAVDRGFEPRSVQTKNYSIGICCFSAKHAALRRKSKDWLARNLNNDVAQGVALPNVTLINPFYIGPYEGYFCVCLGCHNLHLHYKRLSNVPFLVS